MTLPKVGYYLKNKDTASFKIYAPFCDSLAIELDDSHQRIKLNKQPGHYFTADITPLPEGTMYWLVKNGTDVLPDPYSHYQPFDVHGPSMITLPKKPDNSNWQGISYKNAIIYELHLGTFTEEGTLKAACQKLIYLKTLGINVIELMPICAFPGDRNWGYDGTYLFALNSSYGSYDDLKEFIEQAHSLGIAVIQDIVYNHFGPEGNYSGMLAPFTKAADTPWGAAVNYDQKDNSGIRDFYLNNANYWLADVGLDGFRMDATALILDESPKHILTEINELAQEIGAKENRQIIMIAEHLRNESKVTSANGYKFQAQWCDDLNYALYAFLTGETMRHYRDFGSFNDIVKALKSCFVYDGTKLNTVYNNYMGEDGSHLDPATIVAHIQNHDQVGNRPNGDRMSTTYGIKRALTAVTTVFASPYIPMIFMGEEYAEMNPFWFFESFKDQWLIDAVQKGRRNEFSFSEDAKLLPPHDIETFIDSKLDWELPATPPHAQVLEIYKSLIALKKEGIIGPHNREEITIEADESKELIFIKTKRSITVINLSKNDYNTEELGLNSYKLVLNTDFDGVTNDLSKWSARIYLIN